MSDRPGRYARWSAAAFVGPLTAAAFTGSISWAAGHNPHKTTTATVTSKQPAAPAADEINAQLDQVDALRQQVSDLRAQVSELTAPGAHPAKTAGKTRTSTARPQETTTPRATRSSAPAAHTSTGASSG